mmetsp:Transcript_8457/g.21744  ORF Transcript_8457/g.21744 Transcript_8457/m.21744 type:complete len:221 (+) Transcript_8457:127-789(+)
MRWARATTWHKNGQHGPCRWPGHGSHALQHREGPWLPTPMLSPTCEVQRGCMQAGAFFEAQAETAQTESPALPNSKLRCSRRSREPRAANAFFRHGPWSSLRNCPAYASAGWRAFPCASSSSRQARRDGRTGRKRRCRSPCCARKRTACTSHGHGSPSPCSEVQAIQALAARAAPRSASPCIRQERQLALHCDSRWQSCLATQTRPGPRPGHACRRSKGA